jgi:uncharacterized membrane protein YczE
MNLITRLITIATLTLGYISVGYGTVIYTPSAQILLTGSTSTARFDVAAAIIASGSTATVPILNTITSTFSGTFYLKDIGWVLFDTGSTYRVSLNCGAQSLDSLTSPCSITGTGWSETI